MKVFSFLTRIHVSVKLPSHLFNGEGTAWVGIVGIDGRHDLFDQPFFNGRVAGRERAQSISDDFAFARIFPEDTFALTISAISIGRVMLRAWVVRIA